MKRKTLVSAALMLLSIYLIPLNISAHCDGLDGPVVNAAKEALKSGNVNLALIWVQKEDEEMIKKVFEHTVRVRELGEDAQKLADRFFFETLVRIHRAGEGAPFTGLKPAGRDLGPAIPAADEAIETGSPKKLMNLLNDEIHKGLHQRFMKVNELKNYNPGDVVAGQEYVKAYVDYIHFAEGVYEAAQRSGHGESNSDVQPATGHTH